MDHDDPVLQRVAAGVGIDPESEMSWTHEGYEWHLRGRHSEGYGRTVAFCAPKRVWGGALEIPDDLYRMPDRLICEEEDPEVALQMVAEAMFSDD